MKSEKASLFVILGQSNAVGHGLPMVDSDKIITPLRNVFGLSRNGNQALYSTSLNWSGYTSYGTNLAEAQDHTYSVPNCLASLWQKHIDEGNEYGLNDLYIIQIAIGAQGVTEGYMWHPDRAEKLVPGKLGEVDISLFPFTEHVFSLVDDSFRELGMEYEVIGVHWRGGENDVTASRDHLLSSLKGIYERIFDMTDKYLHNPPIIIHKIACPDRMSFLDPSGKMNVNMEIINDVFYSLNEDRENVSILDPTACPYFIPDVRGNGIFIEDAVHFTPEVNKWVAQTVLDSLCGK
jgi:hypothetical protein